MNDWNQKIIFLKGLPASGKSTWAKNKENEDCYKYKIVNKDILREENPNFSENDIIKLQNQLIEKALEDGCSVIIDDTNFNPYHLERMKKIQKTFNEAGFKIDIEEIYFDTPVEVCIERDSKREKKVSKEVIMNMYNQYVTPEKELTNDITKPKVIIVDVDGTVANKAHERSHFEWMKVHLDTPKKTIIDLVKLLHNSGKK